MNDRSEFTVRTATEADVPGIARVLGRAFFEDPLSLWLFPDPHDRAARLARFWAIYVGYWYIDTGETKVAVRSDPDAVVRGAAVWIRPDLAVPDLASLLRTAPHLLELLGPAKFARLAALDAATDAAATPRPHWRLELLGVDPVAQGAGIGSALIRAGLDRADTDRDPVMLETSTDSNVSYYTAFGFKPTGTISAAGAPDHTAMLREPGA